MFFSPLSFTDPNHQQDTTWNTEQETERIKRKKRETDIKTELSDHTQTLKKRRNIYINKEGRNN